MVMNLKEMFAVTATTRFCESLHAEVEKLIPKLAKMHKSLEALVVQGAGTEVPEETFVAISKKMNNLIAEHNEVRKAYTRFFPNRPNKKQKV